MLADESARFGNRLGRSVEINRVVRHFPSPLAREHEQRGNAAIDIDPAVGTRCAGVARKRVKFLLVLAEVLCQFLQHGRAFVKRVLAQVVAADPACVGVHCRKVESL